MSSSACCCCSASSQGVPDHSSLVGCPQPKSVAASSAAHIAEASATALPASECLNYYDADGLTFVVERPSVLAWTAVTSW